MNKIYRVVWNKSTQTWTAVSEYATAQGKSSSRSAVAGSEVKSTKGIRFIYTALASATLMLLSGQAWANPELKAGSAAPTTTGTIVVNSGGSSTTDATGKDSIAIGTNTTATQQSAVAIGTNVTASGTNSAAYGSQSQATANNTTAIGFKAIASGQSAVAVGDGSKATGGQSTAMGVSTTASGAGATAVGHSNTATGEHTVAVGSLVTSSGNNAVAIGKSAQATTQNTIAIGNTAKVSGTTPIDTTSSVMSGISGIAIGNNSEVKNRNYGIAIGDSAFVGTYDQTKNIGSNAHHNPKRDDKSNDAGRPGVAIGWKTQATGDDSIALGNDSISTGRSSVSLGKAAYAEDTDAIAIGNSARAGQAKNPDAATLSSHNSTAIGSYAQAIGGWNTALGTRAYTNNDRALAVGSLASAEGQNATAVGSYSFVEGDGGSALGYHAIVTKKADSGTALGVGTVVDGRRSGGLSAATNGNPTKFVNDGRSYIGGEDNYAIGNKNVVGGKTKNSVALGNNIKLGATAATLVSTHLDGKDNTIAPRTESVTYVDEKALENAIAIGNESSVASHQGIAIGKRANVTEKGLQATAIGGGNYRPDEIASNGAIAVGDSATARGTGSVAVGLNSQTIFMNSSAVGNEANAAGYNSSAFGYQSLANGVSSIAIGDKALAGAQHKDTHVPIANRAIAIGVNSNATGETAVALGSNTDVKKSRGTALGVLSQVVHHDGVALGAYSIANRYQKDEGADPLTAKGFALYTEEEIKNDTEKAKKNAVWKATHAAVSVGNDTPQSQAARQGNSTTIGAFDIPLVTRQITGVAAGSQDTDAVNVAQLKAAGFVVNTIKTANGELGNKIVDTTKKDGDDKVQNGETFTIEADKNIKATQTGTKVSITTKDDVEFSTVTTKDNAGNQTLLNGTGLTITPTGGNNPVSLTSMGLNNGGHKILGVADGNIAQGSTDAVNGGQLFTTNTKVDTNAANIAKGLNFAGNTGAEFNRQLGDKVTISGGLTSGTSSNSNIRTVANNGTIDIQIADAPVFTGKVTGHGFDAGGQKITGVQKGDAANDAVNVAQLEKAINDAKVQSLTKVESNSPFSYINSNGDLLKRDVDSNGLVKYYKVDGGGEYVPKSDNDITITALNPKKTQTSVSVKVGNVAAGTTDNDAVNVSQLENAVKALGATVNPDGTINQPDYEVAGNTLSNVGHAITALDKEVAKPLSFIGDNVAEKVKRKLGTELKVKGGADQAKLSENNIGVVGNTTDNSLTIKLAKDVNLGGDGSLTAGDSKVNNDGLTITKAGKQPVKLTSSGLDNGGNKIINVANGDVTADSTDAVNGSQLHATNTQIATVLGAGAAFDSVTATFTAPIYKVVDGAGNPVAGVTNANNIGDALNNLNTYINKGFDVQGNGTTKGTVTPTEKINFVNGVGTTAVVSDEANGVTNVAFDINAQGLTESAQLPVVYTNANGDKLYLVEKNDPSNPGTKIKVFNTKPDGKGEDVDPPNVIASMQNAIGQTTYSMKLANVADGAITANSKDAVNGSQLFATNQNVTNNANAITGLQNQTFKLQANGDVATAVKASDTVQFLDGDNIAITRNANDITIATKKDVKFDSVIAGGTKLDNGGLTFVDDNGGVVANSPSITKTGINAGGNKITNVDAGTDDSDAVNVGQLKAVNTKAGVKTKVTQGDGVTVTNKGTAEAPSYEVALSEKTKGSLGKADSALQTVKSIDKNLLVTKNGSAITLDFRDDPTFGKVTTGTGTNQVVLDNTGVNVGGNTYISDAGLNANNKKVTNVANGAITADSKDAVNGSQLFAQGEGVKNIIGGNTTYDPSSGTYKNADIGGTGKATIDEAIKASKTTVSSNDSSIKVTKTTDQTTGADNYDISVNAQGLAESAQLPVVYTKKDGTKVYKVGDKFFDNKAGTGTEVPAADIIASMQNADGTTATPTTLANVADGDVNKNSKDAVNGSQLFAQGEGVKNIIGGNTTYDPSSGTYKNADIGGTGKATIDEAIKASKTEVAEGKNVTVTTKTGTNGQTIYTVATKDDVSFNKVTTGTGTNQVVLDNTGVNVGGNTYISDAGLNANNKKVTNVANGAITADSKDAVNGGQLYDTHQAIGQLANQTVNLGNQLNNRIGDVEDKANAGVSSAMAMASLPQAYIPGKSMLTGGLATYNGEGAVAVGLSKLSDNGRWVLKMSGSADTKGNAGASIGAGFHF